MDTPTPAGVNEQHIWGGTVFNYPDSTSNLNVGQPSHVGPLDSLPQAVIPPSSQAHILASSSDDLFHPDVGGPTFVPYRLPPVPNIHAYNLPYSHFSHNPSHIPNNRNHLSQPPAHFLPYPSSTSSYNNPAFQIPPQVLPQQNYQQNFNVPLSQPPLSTAPPYHNYSPQGPPPPVLHNPSSLPASPSPSIHTPLPNHNPQIPIQYVYCMPQTSPSPVPLPSSSFSKTLPSVTHLPTLTNKLDFFAWDEGVTALLRAHGLFGHILDPSTPMQQSRPDLVPAPLPILSVNPSPAELAALSRWWEADNAAQHILVSKIGSIP